MSDIDALRQEINLQTERLDQHIKETTALRKDMDRRFRRGTRQFNRMMKQQKECNEKLDCVVQNTASVQEWDKDLRSAARVGKKLRNFGIFLASIPVAGAGFIWLYKAFLKFALNVEVAE